MRKTTNVPGMCYHPGTFAAWVYANAAPGR